MATRFRKVQAAIVLCVLAVLPATRALAAELGDFCWLTDTGKVLRFSVTLSGNNHYTYTGQFDDGDGVGYDIIGQASLNSGAITGTFSGSLSTGAVFKTGIWHVLINPATGAASIQGIREAYVLGTDPNSVATGYRFHTATLSSCP